MKAPFDPLAIQLIAMGIIYIVTGLLTDYL